MEIFNMNNQPTCPNCGHTLNDCICHLNPDGSFKTKSERGKNK